MPYTADYRLLNFNTYDEYLHSNTKSDVKKYLRSAKIIKQVIKLGYHTNATIYEEDEFYEIKKNLLDQINPVSHHFVLFSSYRTSSDPALCALAEREASNMQKKLSTIIFVQLRQRTGFDISGYIDYEDSLRLNSLQMIGCTNWQAIFEGRILLRPKHTDLSFYDWHSGSVYFNNTSNYDVMHMGISLLFKYKGDLKFIPVSVADGPFKENVKRTAILSPLYGMVVLYDHIVRKAT
ncbi:PREDICTED: uncharacterized protein C4orf22 homolog isoform X1 [Drosophila arizonae]|uniref:Cilia- and flagella-associated protein 299 n=2 Tax=Drosophila arizonae TaxID=7263 RepID=A0ABM1PZR4_DROAR|nr:PREDICTED: uncharacterized protein C4orf22 homolog isoform X1 [Drosophila arizonae]